MKIISGGVCAAKGFKASGVHCGIRKNRTKRDLALIYSEKIADAAAVYTTNLVKGAPLTVTKNHLENGKAQAIICNSGNANTCNANGIEIAERTSELAACALDIHDLAGVGADDRGLVQVVKAFAGRRADTLRTPFFLGHGGSLENGQTVRPEFGLAWPAKLGRCHKAPPLSKPFATFAGRRNGPMVT